jgi:uncharacterized membrane protein
MANDFIKLSPLMVIGVIAAVVAFVAGYSAYMTWQDHKPEMQGYVYKAAMVCVGSLVVSGISIWLTRRRWMGEEDD